MLLVAAGAIAPYICRRDRPGIIGVAAIVIAVGVTLMPSQYRAVPFLRGEALMSELTRQSATFWSPYQRIEQDVFKVAKTGQFAGLELAVNRAYYQHFFNPA